MTTRNRRWWGGRGLAAAMVALGATSAGAQEVTGATGAEPVIHPSDVVAERTGLGPGVSRALVRVIRTHENAIPVIADAVVRPATSEGRVALIGYQVSANEACVRERAPEGRAALRAARDACRDVRGIESVVVAIRCTSAPRGADACGATEILWMAALGGSENEGQRRYRETLDGIHIVDANIDADPEKETIVDWSQESYYFDPTEIRSGGDVSNYTREAIVVDADGSVLARPTVNGDAYGQEDTHVHARIVDGGVQVAMTACEAGTEGCRIPWGRAIPIAREPIVRPQVAPAAPPTTVAATVPPAG